MSTCPHFARHPDLARGSLLEQLEALQEALRAPPPRGSQDRVSIDEFPGKGRGLRAARSFAAGEDILAIEPFASCDIYFGIEARIAVFMGLFTTQYAINATQVDCDRYIFFGAPAVLANHGCDPNTAFVAGRPGGYTYRALRRIAPGEEITWDYSTTIGDYFVMQCAGCGPSCRGFASRPSFMIEAQRRQLRERHPAERLLPHMVAELDRSFSCEGIDPHLLPYGWDGDGSLAEFVARNPNFDERFKSFVATTRC